MNNGQSSHTQSRAKEVTEKNIHNKLISFHITSAFLKAKLSDVVRIKEKRPYFKMSNLEKRNTGCQGKFKF